MNFYDIPNRIESDVVRRAVCAVLLAEADEAELMSEDACLYLSSIYDLCGTDYEDMSRRARAHGTAPPPTCGARFTALSCCRPLKGTLSARD